MPGRNVMDDEKLSKLAVNVANARRMASNWVMAGAGIAFAVYLQLPADQQKALLEHLPVAPWLLPIIVSTVGIVARLWPQNSITPYVAAAKSDQP
jgi:hypothetical protein